MLQRLCQLIRQLLAKANQANPKAQASLSCQIFQVTLKPANPAIQLWNPPRLKIMDALTTHIITLYDGLEALPTTLYSLYSATSSKTSITIKSSLFQQQAFKNKPIFGLKPLSYKNKSIKIQRPSSQKNTPTTTISIIQTPNNVLSIPTLSQTLMKKIAPPQAAYLMKITATALYRLPTETRRKLRHALSKQSTHPENDIQLLNIFQNLPQAYQSNSELKKAENNLTLRLQPSLKKQKQHASKWTYVVGRSIKNAQQMLDANLEEDALN